MRMRLLILLLLTSTALSGYAQQYNFHDQVVDSFLIELKKPSHDTVKMNSFLAFSRYQFNAGQYEDALRTAQSAIRYFRGKEINGQLPRLYYNAGMSATNLVKYDSATQYLDTSIALATKEGNNEVVVLSIIAKALMSDYRTDYEKAVNYYVEALAIINKVAPALNGYYPKVYSGMGRCLIVQKQYEKGIAYNKLVLNYKGFADEKRYHILAALNVSDGYISLQNFDSSKKYLDIASQLYSGLKNPVLGNLIHNTEGYFYYKRGDYSKAKAAYEKAVVDANEAKNYYLLVEVYDNLTNLYFDLRDFNSTKKYAMMAIEGARKHGQISILANSFNVLSNVYKLEGDYRNAYEYATLFKVYSDSSSNEQTRKEILSLESKYEFEKNRQEIAQLTITNLKRQAEINRNYFTISIGAVIGIILLAILFYFYSRYKHKALLAEKETKLKEEKIVFLEGQQQMVAMKSMIEGQEAERARIARDLHDGLGGIFSTIKMYFSTIREQSQELKEQPLFNKSIKMVDDANEELRRVAFNLMPEVLTRMGLSQAILELANSITHGGSLKVLLQDYTSKERFHSNAETTIYRILQELLNNVQKHAEATEVVVQMNQNDQMLTITVEDNGKGFDLNHTMSEPHAGLTTIQNRVSYLKGKYTIESVLGVGTSIFIEIPNASLYKND